MLGNYKFRARDFDGNLVCGGITAGGDFIIVNARKFVTVDKDSIRQLVGYDCDGNEVYEGDIVISPGGRKYVAELRAGVKDTVSLGDNFYRQTDTYKLFNRKE